MMRELRSSVLGLLNGDRSTLVMVLPADSLGDTLPQDLSRFGMVGGMLVMLHHQIEVTKQIKQTGAQRLMGIDSRSSVDKQIEKMLELLGNPDFLRDFPEGLQSEFGEEVTKEVIRLLRELSLWANMGLLIERNRTEGERRIERALEGPRRHINRRTVDLISHHGAAELFIQGEKLFPLGITPLLTDHGRWAPEPALVLNKSTLFAPFSEDYEQALQAVHLVVEIHRRTQAAGYPPYDFNSIYPYSGKIVRAARFNQTPITHCMQLRGNFDQEWKDVRLRSEEKKRKFLEKLKAQQGRK